jgi:hypothetical protein
VIHRLCAFPNESTIATSPYPQACVTLSAQGQGASRGGAAYGVMALSGTVQPYYRITSRVVGPNSTVSYVQTIMF